jgi:hypothetical protein
MHCLILIFRIKVGAATTLTHNEPVPQINISIKVKSNRKLSVNKAVEVLDPENSHRLSASSKGKFIRFVTSNFDPYFFHYERVSLVISLPSLGRG